MARIDLRINLSFKNTPYELELYNFIKEKGNIMGDSAYIKMLVDRAMRDEKEKESNK